MGRIIAGVLLLGAFACAREWKLRIDGMHCIACTLAVKKALMGVEGVKEARVNFKTETAIVSADETVTLRAMQDAVAQTGYRAEESKK